MKRTVRCAVIGAGSWGTTAHVPALKSHPQAELVAIQHRDVRVATRIARDFDLQHGYDSAEDILAVDGLEAVIVSSTPNMHFPHAMSALRQGLHVLLEKPMALTLAEARQLVQTAERQGVHFLIGCPWHYTEHAAIAQQLVRSGELGDVRMICVLMTDYCMGLYQSLAWREMFADQSPAYCTTPYLEPERTSYSDPSISGGGQIYAQVSHPAAYLTFLTGQEPQEVHARFNCAGTPVDVYNTLNIKLDAGTLVSLASTGDIGKTSRNLSVRVYGSQAILEMELFKGTMSVWSHDGNVRHYPPLSEDQRYPIYSPATNLVDAILGKSPNRSPATLGLSAMKIIEGACESARTGSNVVIGEYTNRLSGIT